MRQGQGSQTAVLVCIARAIAHDQALAGFRDPTAEKMLPDDARARVERYRHGPPSDVKARLDWEFMTARAAMMAVRTMVIDDAVREAAAPQVVILGAGYDGRAWRMPELAGAIVFEIDHPATQALKRARVTELERTAREVRFVAVDFTKDDLDAKLAEAGHDTSRPTMWIWEGVVMYLTPEEVDATLAIIARRSAPKSRIAIVYHAPGGMILRVVGLLVRRMGEPFRSKFTAAQMRALLTRYDFTAKRDEDLPESTERIAPALVARSRKVKHMRLVTAERD
jgi:methyltransferase (TIGR00027 family)